MKGYLSIRETSYKWVYQSAVSINMWHRDASLV